MLSTTSHRLRGALSWLRSHPDTCKKRKQLGSTASQGAQVLRHIQGLSKMRLEHTDSRVHARELTAQDATQGCRKQL